MNKDASTVLPTADRDAFATTAERCLDRAFMAIHELDQLIRQTPGVASSEEGRDPDTEEAVEVSLLVLERVAAVAAKLGAEWPLIRFRVRRGYRVAVPLTAAERESRQAYLKWLLAPPVPMDFIWRPERERHLTLEEWLASAPQRHAAADAEWDRDRRRREKVAIRRKSVRTVRRRC